MSELLMLLLFDFMQSSHGRVLLLPLFVKRPSVGHLCESCILAANGFCYMYLHVGQNVVFVNVIDVIVFMCHHSIANTYICMHVHVYMCT